MKRRWVILATAAIAAASPASAAIIDVSFGGTFDTYYTGCSPFSQPSPGNCVSSPIATSFTGSFSYSTQPGFGIFGGTVSSNAFATVGRPTTLNSTGTNGFAYRPLPGNNLSYQNMLGSLFFMDLAVLTFAYPSSVAVDPAAPPALSAAQSATFSYTTSGSPGGTGPRLTGVISALSAVERVSAVPEPSSWALLFVGFGVIGTGLRRSRRTAARSWRQMPAAA